MTQKNFQLFIFRRDLRIHDNTALEALHEHPEPIIPIFIFAPDQIDPTKNPYFSNNSVQFMCESLNDLENSIKEKSGRMNFFHGETITILEKLLKFPKYKIVRIGVNQDYTPYSRERDEKIEALCKKYGIEFLSREDICIQPIGSVKTGSGTIYKKYTPYYNKAKELPIRKPVKRTTYNFAKLQLSPKNSSGLLTKFYNKNPNLLHPGGRENALRQLAHLPADYQKTRNTPSIPTTELSAYNKFGCISIRELMEKLDKDISRELYFRDFYYNIIFYYPYILGGAFEPKWDKIKWDKPAPKILTAFYEGRTGFPIIDAGIRQMTTTGFMHNRVRMLVASFFTKDLLYDWRIGERFFANNLYDYDPTQNNCGWQVVAGFGPSALDWFRVMNPWLQTEKFDPECIYIKKWVPELSNYSAKQIINQDWNAKDYPRPIVSHEEAKKKMMAAYKNVKYIMDKRHFTVVEKNGKEHGLYVSSTPSSAAKKAVTKLCASNKSKKVEFYLREITQGSKKKTYGLYLGEMKKLKTPIKLKGRVIYFETIVHLKKVKNTMKGGNFTCAGNTKEIKELCIDDELGLFSDKTECEKSCLNNKLNVELEAWKKLFEWCSVNLPHNRIYCKGGSTLGLEVLKSILDLKFIEFTELKNKFNYTEFVTSKNNISENEFVRKKFNEFVEPEYKEFLSFNLIKDWDFTVFMTENQRNDFFIYATQTLGFNKEGKKIFMIRYGNGLKIGDDNLLELSAKIDETLDDLELPLTSLKFEVNYRNIDLFFEIVKMYVKNDIKLERMLEILNELLSYIVVNGTDLVNSIQNGLYTITDPKKISTAGLSNELLRIIDESVGISNRGLNSSFNRSRNNRESINPLTMKQFLITQFSQPDRLFIRFYGKNVQKSIKIRKFYEKNGIPLPLWLIDETILEEILLKIDRFLDIFNRHIESKIQINDEFFENPKPVFKIFIDEMDILLQGVNIPNLKLTNIKLEDLNQIEKLVPMNIFEALKIFFLEKEKMKNLEKLTKQFPNETSEIRAQRIHHKNMLRKRDLKYATFLPSGKNMVKPKNSKVKPIYYAFLGTFLAKKSS